MLSEMLNVRVLFLNGCSYVAAWLRGIGCVPIHNLMEDAATAEIARVQGEKGSLLSFSGFVMYSPVWQWLKHGVKLADGRVVSRALVTEAVRTN